MAKLSQLLMLEGMLNTYDNMNIKDAWIVEKQGESVEELVDVIIAKLNRLLESKTRLSCRNVLVANFETMTKTEHWLNSKLFADLPKDLGKVLRDKIDQMVDLLRALIVKIIDVEADFADRFFDKLKKLYLKKRKRITDYEVWKADQSHLTIERITGFQAEITTRMLIMGILKYDDDPDEEEVDGVDLERLRKKLKKNRPLPENFDKECAKLRRYSHWEGDMFMIDYQDLRKYLFCAFGKLTCDQHIEMYEYDIQMKQIHEDIKRLKEEGMSAEEIQNVDEKNEEEIVLSPDEEALLTKLSPIFYGSVDNAKLFISSIQDMKGKQITDMVNQLIAEKKLSKLSCHRGLYTVLHDAGIYDKSESNWNMQVK